MAQRSPPHFSQPAKGGGGGINEDKDDKEEEEKYKSPPIGVTQDPQSKGSQVESDTIDKEQLLAVPQSNKGTTIKEQSSTVP